MKSISSTLRLTSLSLAALAAAGALSPVNSAIENKATASGSYGATPVTSNESPATVQVAPASGSLTIDKSAGVPTVNLGADTTITDADDTITYTYTVKNTGKVTLSAVTPVDPGPTFGGKAGTGTMGAFTLTSGTLPLAPDATAVFTAEYELSALDAYHAAGITNGVANSATAEGEHPGGATITSPPDTAETTITAGPALTISKLASLDDTNGTVANAAELNETITYTYTITNTGNVALTDVSVTDEHEGANLLSTVYTGEAIDTEGPMQGDTPAVVSTDSTANDGVWSVLQPGASITITYVHTVTQAEVDNQ